MTLPKLKRRNDGLSSNVIILAFLVLGIFLFNVHVYEELGSAVNMDRRLSLSLASTDQMLRASSGSRRGSMMEWRESLKNECHELIKAVGKKVGASAIDRKELLERSFIQKIEWNTQPSKISASKHDPYVRCSNAFIDLGANIGDSVGYFVDNTIDVCSPSWVENHPQTRINDKFPRPHLDVTNLDFVHRGSKPNPLFNLLQRLTKGSPSATSESFCVYGMEGNPAFTERLTKLENFITDMNPRPVQHVHIFTESVVTATDGPTKLYLDKTSVEQNVRKTSLSVGFIFPKVLVFCSYSIFRPSL